MVNWLGIILLFIVAIIVYKLVKKITQLALKLLTFIIVLVAVYIFLSQLKLI